MKPSPLTVIQDMLMQCLREPRFFSQGTGYMCDNPSILRRTVVFDGGKLIPGELFQVLTWVLDRGRRRDEL